MTITQWQNGFRVDTRREQSGSVSGFLHLPEGMDATSLHRLQTACTARGLRTDLALIPQSTQAIRVHGLSAEDRQALHTALQPKLRPGTSTEIEGDELLITGLTSEASAGFRRWIERYGRRHQLTPELESYSAPLPPLQGLQVSGAKDEKSLFRMVEELELGTGKRRDEYTDLSPWRKRWTQMVEQARSWMAASFLVGDGLTITSTVVDAHRRGINPLAHEQMAEGLGFATGSGLVLLGEKLAKPASEEAVVTRALNAFRSGDGFDFSHSGPFERDGAVIGRGPQLVRQWVQHNNVESLMLADLWAGSGMWRGRKMRTFADRKDADGFHVVLDDEGGAMQTHERHKWNDYYSGIAYPTAAAITAFVPKEGDPKPFMHYRNMGNQLTENPFVSGLRKAWDGFRDSPIGQAIAYPFEVASDFMTRDPYKVGGALFLSHNIGQIVFNGLYAMQDRGKRNAMRSQFEDKYEALLTQTDVSFKGETLPLTTELRQKLAELYDTHTPMLPIRETDASGAPVEYGNRMLKELAEKRQRVGNEGLSTEDRFLMQEASDRYYLTHLEKQTQSLGLRFAAYATFLFGNGMLAMAGKKHDAQSNALETQVNPLAVVRGMAEKLQAANLSPEQREQAVTNIATYLHQDEALTRYGFSQAEYQEMLRAKLTGRTSEVEAAYLAQSPLLSVILTPSEAKRKAPAAGVMSGGEMLRAAQHDGLNALASLAAAPQTETATPDNMRAVAEIGDRGK
jgi:hypothetical protein